MRTRTNYHYICFRSEIAQIVATPTYALDEDVSCYFSHNRGYRLVLSCLSKRIYVLGSTDRTSRLVHSNGRACGL